MREWDDTNGDALAHAVVSVPVVLETDLVLLVISEVVLIVDVDLVPGDVTPNVVTVRLARLRAEGDQSIPARAVIVVDSNELSIKSLSVMLPDDLGGHRSHEIVLEGKVLGGDSEWGGDLLHNSSSVRRGVPWLSKLLECATLAVLVAAFGVGSEPEDVSFVDLDHVFDSAVDLNTDGGSLGVVVGDDLVSAGLGADEAVDLFSAAGVPVIEAGTHMSAAVDAVHLHAVVRLLIVVDDDEHPTVGRPELLEVGEKRVGDLFVGGDGGVLGEKTGGDSLELNLPVLSGLAGERTSRLVRLDVSWVRLLDVTVDVGLGDVVSVVISAPLVSSSTYGAFFVPAAGASVNSRGNTQESSAHDQLHFCDSEGGRKSFSSKNRHLLNSHKFT